MASVKDGQRNLALKFGQNQVSKCWDVFVVVADVDDDVVDSDHRFLSLIKIGSGIGGILLLFLFLLIPDTDH